MKAKSLMIVALAAFCCLGTQARSKKKIDREAGGGCRC